MASESKEEAPSVLLPKCFTGIIRSSPTGTSARVSCASSLQQRPRPSRPLRRRRPPRGGPSRRRPTRTRVPTRCPTWISSVSFLCGRSGIRVLGIADICDIGPRRARAHGLPHVRRSHRGADPALVMAQYPAAQEKSVLCAQDMQDFKRRSRCRLRACRGRTAASSAAGAL